MSRPPLEVADIVRHYGDAYLARYGAVTSTAQYRVLQAVAQCRTAVLGGHKSQCDRCGHEVRGALLSCGVYSARAAQSPRPAKSSHSL